MSLCYAVFLTTFELQIRTFGSISVSVELQHADTANDEADLDMKM